MKFACIIVFDVEIGDVSRIRELVIVILELNYSSRMTGFMCCDFSQVVDLVCRSWEIVIISCGFYQNVGCVDG